MSLISQAKIKFVQSLKHKKYRQKHESYVIEGLKACQTALQAGMEPNFVVYQNIYQILFLHRFPASKLMSESWSRFHHLIILHKCFAYVRWQMNDIL